MAPSVHRAIEMLDSGRVDLIAYEIPEIAEYKDRLVPCGPRSETHQVLVQPKIEGKAQITDVTDLPGHEVAVEDGTKYLYRLENLDDELGGGIKINAIDADTIDAEALIEMVADRKIPLTIVDNNIAQVNATYFPTLDISVDVSFPQASAWAVSEKHAWLGDSIDAWLNTDESRAANAEPTNATSSRRKPPTWQCRSTSATALSRNMTTGSRNTPRASAGTGDCSPHRAFQESRFDPKAKSWAGARGLMQAHAAHRKSLQPSGKEDDRPRACR